MLNRLCLLISCAALALGAAAAQSSRGIHVGSTVEVDEPVDTNLYAAGARVTVSVPVSGKTHIAGAHVEIGSGARLSRNTALAGGDIIVKGTIDGDLHAAGGHVTIDGPVAGNASIAAGQLELGPNARIGGKLRYRAGHFERDPDAQVAGGIERRERHGRTWDSTPFGRWMWTAGLMLLAAIIAGVLPDAAARMAQELRTRPWLPPLLGFVALICIPIAAVIIMITIIGIPLGLLALLGYVALLFVGYLCTSVVAGRLVLDRIKTPTAELTAWRMLAAALAVLAIALLAYIPVIGGFVKFAALIVGVGMILAAIFPLKPPAAAPTA